MIPAFSCPNLPPYLEMELGKALRHVAHREGHRPTPIAARRARLGERSKVAAEVRKLFDDFDVLRVREISDMLGCATSAVRYALQCDMDTGILERRPSRKVLKQGGDTLEFVYFRKAAS